VRSVTCFALGLMLSLAAPLATAQGKKPDAKSKDLAPIPLKLPRPAFKGTPKNIPPGTTVEKPTGKPRPPFMAPKGTVNVAKGKPVKASDEDPIIGTLDMVTDGDKEATEGSYVELGFATQYVQVDLKAKHNVYAIVFWFFHGTSGLVCHDVVLQTADDPDFITGVKTLFNNDHDNSSGLGIGKDREFFELRDGRLIDTKGKKLRYLRLYCRGSTGSPMNRFTEIEVYGKPAK
jgi:hypothetical protein